MFKKFLGMAVGGVKSIFCAFSMNFFATPKVILHTCWDNYVISASFHSGGVKVAKKWPFLAFFQTFFCDNFFYVKDIQTKVLKHDKDW